VFAGESEHTPNSSNMHVLKVLDELCDTRIEVGECVCSFLFNLPAEIKTVLLHNGGFCNSCTTKQCLHIRGLQFYTFLENSIGIKRKMVDNGKKKLFTFCKMFENVEFFSHLHFKYAKSAILGYLFNFND
jgi:hypothetical protein